MHLTLFPFTAVQFDQQRSENKCFIRSLSVSSAISSELKFGSSVLLWTYKLIQQIHRHRTQGHSCTHTQVIIPNHYRTPLYDLQRKLTKGLAGAFGYRFVLYGWVLMLTLLWSSFSQHPTPTIHTQTQPRSVAFLCIHTPRLPSLGFFPVNKQVCGFLVFFVCIPFDNKRTSSNTLLCISLELSK